MGLTDTFKISRGTKTILIITLSVTFIAVLFAFFYYRGINKSEDPRIALARELLLEYESATATIQPVMAFHLLDSAFAIFDALPDYNSSFEKGVIFNNKCSGLLLMAIYDKNIGEEEKNNLMDLSLKYCDSSIIHYKRWLHEWEELSTEEITEKLNHFMREEDAAFRGLNFRKIFLRRLKNVSIAQIETPRRLSVSYTNKGTIFRHKLEPDSSLAYYKMALDLWKDNRTAKSNLNVLLGGEPIKPNLIESLFPPEKNKK